ncbi:hypothetical protein [Brevundimonas subvibrioides]|uniref:Uncharacterized protein n=1 Tax=Brevundimonas subvibrioides (strain ATCC 15264 / DSM 4735 / LMG 14903 / NBRC 16000 / CB 81) TaxID=633149 RepID=D9QI64_BRESC|nr:hypothetical protein [Brevundimonas subvibrioides]ADL01322.1 conserved hypothetical protein [Brevundimonas subvibrioides ATCC 15264]
MLILRHVGWRPLALVIALAGVTNPVSAQTTGPAQDVGDSIRDRFVAAVEACGTALSSTPGVVVDTSSSIDIHYSPDDRSIHLGRWADLDTDSRGVIEAWASKGTMGLSPEQMFSETFNSIMAPHELGHFLQDISGRSASLGMWDGELEANRIAVAFWAMQPGADGRVVERVGNITPLMDDVPDPVPAEEDPKAFFETHYDAFMRGEDGPLNPVTYSWFQARLLTTALEEPEAYPFCDLVQINQPL